MYFTSDFVCEEICKRLAGFSIRDHIRIVVDHLKNQQEDRGGLHLQKTVSMLLSKGRKVKWQFRVVNDGGGNIGARWSTYQTCAREVIKHYTISEQLAATDKVLVSTNPNFPLVGIVFSAPAPLAVINLF